MGGDAAATGTGTGTGTGTTTAQAGPPVDPAHRVAALGPVAFLADPVPDQIQRPVTVALVESVHETVENTQEFSPEQRSRKMFHFFSL